MYKIGIITELNKITYPNSCAEHTVEAQEMKAIFITSDYVLISP